MRRRWEAEGVLACSVLFARPNPRQALWERGWRVGDAEVSGRGLSGTLQQQNASGITNGWVQAPVGAVRMRLGFSHQVKMRTERGRLHENPACFILYLYLIRGCSFL